MCSLMRKLALLPVLAGLGLVSGCQTHDRVLYNPEPEPVRLNSVRVTESRTITGEATQPADDLGLLPEPGLEGSTLIP